MVSPLLENSSMVTAVYRYIRKLFTVRLRENIDGHLKYYFVLVTCYAGVFLGSQISSIKLVSVYGLTMTGSFFVCPTLYIFISVISEVYGYKNARLAVWCGFLLSAIFIFIVNIVGLMPASPVWTEGEAYNTVLILGTRSVAASFVSTFLTDFIAIYMMARNRLRFLGRSLPQRIFKATLAAVLIEIISYIGLAYYGVISNEALLVLMFFEYIKKILLVLLFFPIILYGVYVFKRLEGIDVFDFETDFNPFKLDNVYDLEGFRISENSN